MQRWLIALGILGIASAAWAANQSCPSGLLTPTPQTATGASANTVTARAAPAIAFEAQNTAGTATVQIEICCFGTCDPVTGAWAVVENSPMSLTVNALAKGVANPTCQYRANATACTGCSVTVGFACSGS